MLSHKETTKWSYIYVIIFANLKHSPQTKLTTSWVAYSLSRKEQSTKLCKELVVYVGSVHPKGMNLVQHGDLKLVI